MKLQYGQGAEVSMELGQSQAFQIQATGAAFRLLSSGLYSDKIGAVIREIGCNAYDAHTAAGISGVPFEVKLPNAGDPLFYIKDFGPGLTAGEVYRIYTTYFMSTKQDSNDFTGGFGLGSKSPFAYTDSFTLTAVKGGVKRVYMAHFNAAGEPALTALSETEVDATDVWQSGLMVSFPVQSSDFREFETKAQAIFRNFATMPAIIGTLTEFRSAQFTLEGSLLRWGPLEKGPSSGVMMGNVLYPLDVHKVGLSSNVWFREKCEQFKAAHPDVKGIAGLDAALQKFMETGTYLKLPIGMVQVTTSREALEYNPDSRLALTKAMLDAMVEFARHVRSMVDDESKTEWERRLACRAFAKGEHNDNRFELGDVLAWWTYAGLPTDGADYFFQDTLNLPVWLGSAIVKSCFVGEKAGRSKSAWSKPIFNGHMNAIRMSLPIQAGIAIVVADTPYAVERVKGAVNNGQLKAAVMLSARKADQARLEQELQTLLGELGHPPSGRTSDLDAVSIKKYVSSTPSASRKTEHISLLSKLCEVRHMFGQYEGEKQSMSLGAVPDSCKYFMLVGQEQTSSRRNANRGTYWTDNPESGRANCRQVDADRAGRIMKAFKEAVKQAVPGVAQLGITGFVRVTRPELKRLKLEELGYKSLLLTISNHLVGLSTLRSFGLALEAFPPQRFNGSAGQYLVAALKNGGVLGALVKRKIGKTKLGTQLKVEASGYSLALSDTQNALKALLREWGREMAINEKLSLLAGLHDSSQESTNVDKLVSDTLPGFADFVKRMGYQLSQWRDLTEKDAVLPPGFEAMFSALLSPDAAATTLAEFAETEDAPSEAIAA